MKNQQQQNKSNIVFSQEVCERVKHGFWNFTDLFNQFIFETGSVVSRCQKSSLAICSELNWFHLGGWFVQLYISLTSQLGNNSLLLPFQFFSFEMLFYVLLIQSILLINMLFSWNGIDAWMHWCMDAWINKKVTRMLPAFWVVTFSFPCSIF